MSRTDRGPVNHPAPHVDCAAVPAADPTRHARTVILLTGLIVVFGVSLVMLVRGTDPVEVAAVLFFAPVFAGLLYLGPGGGLALAAGATAAYVAMRWPAIQLVGWEPLVGRIATRGVGYVLFGLAGGWATRTLLGDLRHLSEIGEVDPATGLHTAAAFARLARAEMLRSDRYGGTFTAALLPLTGLPARHVLRRRALAELGAATRSALRKSDHLALVTVDGRPILAVILTGTDADGAEPAIDHLREAAARTGFDVEAARIAVYPADPEGVASILGVIEPGPTTTSPT